MELTTIDKWNQKENQQMKTLKTTMMNLSIRAKMAHMNMLTKKDAGESHVIAVIAMCVIGVALVLVLSGALKPMITTMCSTMSEKINSMFTGL